MLILLIGAAASSVILVVGITSANRDQDNLFRQVSSLLFLEFDQALSDYVVAGQWVHQAFRQYRTSSQNQADFEEVCDCLKATGLRFQAISFAMNVSSEEEREAMENETRAFLALHNPEVNYTGFKAFQPEARTRLLLSSPRCGTTPQNGQGMGRGPVHVRDQTGLD